MLPVFQNNPRYPRRGNINGDAPRTSKCQERAMDNRRSSGARKKAKLNRPCYWPENVKQNEFHLVPKGAFGLRIRAAP